MACTFLKDLMLIAGYRFIIFTQKNYAYNHFIFKNILLIHMKFYNFFAVHTTYFQYLKRDTILYSDIYKRTKYKKNTQVFLGYEKHYILSDVYLSGV